MGNSVKFDGFIIFTSLLMAITVLCGCGDKSDQPISPSMADIKSAIDRNIVILNERTGADIKRFTVEAVELDESCYEHLDYYAQTLIFTKIYYPENDYLNINCNADPK
tara:strand:+ start:176 stop:499 length:324 start_codon:yes stop_codon:yes gene_type:complete